MVIKRSYSVIKPKKTGNIPNFSDICPRISQRREGNLSLVDFLPRKRRSSAYRRWISSVYRCSKRALLGAVRTTNHDPSAKRYALSRLIPIIGPGPLIRAGLIPAFMKKLAAFAQRRYELIYKSRIFRLRTKSNGKNSRISAAYSHVALDNPTHIVLRTRKWLAKLDYYSQILPSRLSRH